MKYIWRYKTPIGHLGIAETDGAISHILFEEEKSPPEFEETETPVIKSAAAQLMEYFDGGRKSFSFPLLIQGTVFQKTVWNALIDIPYGETRSYKEIAATINKPKAVRAVGMANHCNRLPIVIPCHRVVGADGSLTGYAGGLPVKRLLLDLESRYV